MESVSVVAAVICRKDKYLVGQRPLNKRYGGLWEFPGGKCRNGESKEKALRREVMEELGVSVGRIGPAQGLVQDCGSDHVIMFITVSIEGEPRCIEHLDLQWATADELKQLDLAPSDRTFAHGLQ